ncbi:30S ribosomal protein S1 [Peptacetobacter hiranonis]|uniref:S1 RNA binding domain protein n=1 Tax=Peptacetobacter hiranonis (strain DSM 13275 / JCM 10541 / KCTC 15199 / TO-931) TaxID=500633 RepID=B6FW94_PEPHT|nr:S1 RNA-binding domain-containing protein [Peptacetobacter hiranonis]EEA86221.1 S1 RNA binding domain protein [Peptacetobacter hiranonis DSM 13275]QEK21314.1 30S ribosomal protein S1 [Peptacetobacter hiranonis]
MAELTMQEMLDLQDQEMKKIQIGATITGKVTSIDNEEIKLELEDCAGFEGVVPVSELNLEKGKYADEAYKVGDEITGVITNVRQKDTTVTISKLKADSKLDYAELKEALENHTILTLVGTKAIDRGIFATYKTQELFIPISQLDTKFVQDTKNYVGKSLEVYVKELDARRNRAVASRREVLQERLDKERAERNARIKAEREAERARIREEKAAERARVKAEKEAMFDALEVGQKKEGKVTKIMQYGAFVDIGGIEGLVHRNNLSWDRVENVEDFVTEGQEVEVYVLNIDQENRKFGLALKDINNDPWKIASEEISVGDIINVEVLRIIESGAFVKVRESVEAYLPISELSEDRVLKVQNVVNEGDEIKVKVIEFSYKNRRMKVSKVEAEREPEEDISEYLEVEDSLGSLGELFKDKFKDLDVE